jgi:hypothetical protein
MSPNKWKNSCVTLYWQWFAVMRNSCACHNVHFNEFEAILLSIFWPKQPTMRLKSRTSGNRQLAKHALCIEAHSGWDRGRTCPSRADLHRLRPRPVASCSHAPAKASYMRTISSHTIPVHDKHRLQATVHIYRARAQIPPLRAWVNAQILRGKAKFGYT